MSEVRAVCAFCNQRSVVWATCGAGCHWCNICAHTVLWQLVHFECLFLSHCPKHPAAPLSYKTVPVAFVSSLLTTKGRMGHFSGDLKTAKEFPIRLSCECISKCAVSGAKAAQMHPHLDKDIVCPNGTKVSITDVDISRLKTQLSRASQPHKYCRPSSLLCFHQETDDPSGSETESVDADTSKKKKNRQFSSPVDLLMRIKSVRTDVSTDAASSSSASASAGPSSGHSSGPSASSSSSSGPSASSSSGPSDPQAVVIAIPEPLDPDSDPGPDRDLDSNSDSDPVSDHADVEVKRPSSSSSAAGSYSPNKVNAKVDEVKAKVDEIRAQADRIKLLQESVNQAVSTIKVKDDQIKAKDDMIKRLRELSGQDAMSIKIRDAENKHLKESCVKATATIKAKVDEVKDLADETKALSDIVKARDETIKRLQESAAQLTSTLRAKADEVKAKDEEISRLQESLVQVEELRISNQPNNNNNNNNNYGANVPWTHLQAVIRAGTKVDIPPNHLAAYWSYASRSELEHITCPYAVVTVTTTAGQCQGGAGCPRHRNAYFIPESGAEEINDVCASPDFPSIAQCLPCPGKARSKAPNAPCLAHFMLTLHMMREQSGKAKLDDYYAAAHQLLPRPVAN